MLLPTVHPLRIPEFLKSKGIETIICGGIPHPVLIAAQQEGLSVTQNDGERFLINNTAWMTRHGVIRAVNTSNL